MLTQLPGQDVVLPTLVLIDIPITESPAQHCRNALQLLSLLRQMSPAVWQLNSELTRAQRRAEAAVMMLEHSGPPACAALHVRRAIEALLEVPLDWNVVEMIPAALARLFAAWFALTASAEAN